MGFAAESDEELEKAIVVALKATLKRNNTGLGKIQCF